MVATWNVPRRDGKAHNIAASGQNVLRKVSALHLHPSPAPLPIPEADHPMPVHGPQQQQQ